MSHTVIVDYEGMSIRIQSQCQTAANSLCKIDKVLNRIHETASNLESEDVKKYEQYLLYAKKEIQSSIDSFVASLEEYKSLKQRYVNDNGRYEFDKLQIGLTNKGNDLINKVNELTGSKLEVIDQMITEGLIEAGSKAVTSLYNKANGVLDLDKSILDKINAIEDISLRELTYLQFIKEENKNLDFETLLAKGQEEYDILLGKMTKQVIEQCKAELKANNISTDIIKDVKTIDEATALTNEAIIDESIRKETLKVIIKSIKERGFIVDTKKNLKIDKEKNIVKLVALKASGQKAEFEIHLDGKFMYHFDGYEGLACNKDIEPFIEDLKNIYDINILHEEYIWSNPDKISTQKYQQMNTKKGTN